MSGYVTTKAMLEDAKHTVYQSRVMRRRVAVPSWPPRKTRASNWLSLPLVMGRFLVRDTRRSRSASHMSFIVQPAPEG